MNLSSQEDDHNLIWSVINRRHESLQDTNAGETEELVRCVLIFCRATKYNFTMC